LTRAALRRAWSADPTIRDFIGLSENSWDFNAPGGVPGFGSLTAEDARRLLARLMGETEGIDPARPVAAGEQAPGSPRDETRNVAMQHETEERESYQPRHPLAGMTN
jgi:hypothetical protein